MDISPSSSEISINPVKEKICEEIKSFKHLTDLVFLIGAIDEETRNKIIRFDSERDDIAHDLLKMEILPQKLEQLCSLGLELMDILENYFSRIVPQPNFIEMRKFEVISFNLS